MKVKGGCLGFLLVQLFEEFCFFVPYFCPGIFWENGVFVWVLCLGFTLFFTLCQGGYMIFDKWVTDFLKQF
ncbi:MAG: hypothetical protein EAZ76_00975 [Nostocales cyanobacterium]|nr:MAG: hypothetical protein EAZ87_03380 [Nostocales cyanobacterium]TAF20874.1 MAG: hypothetical protein EAZ76_00975 [Nostocales cyanobacterium]